MAPTSRPGGWSHRRLIAGLDRHTAQRGHGRWSAGAEQGVGSGREVQRCSRGTSRIGGGDAGEVLEGRRPGRSRRRRRRGQGASTSSNVLPGPIAASPGEVGLGSVVGEGGLHRPAGDGVGCVEAVVGGGDGELRRDSRGGGLRRPVGSSTGGEGRSQQMRRATPIRVGEVMARACSGFMVPRSSTGRARVMGAGEGAREWLGQGKHWDGWPEAA